MVQDRPLSVEKKKRKLRTTSNSIQENGSYDNLANEVYEANKDRVKRDEASKPDDEDLEKITQSIITAFFIALFVKIVMYIWSRYF